MDSGSIPNTCWCNFGTGGGPKSKKRVVRTPQRKTMVQKEMQDCPSSFGRESGILKLVNSTLQGIPVDILSLHFVAQGPALRHSFDVSDTFSDRSAHLTSPCRNDIIIKALCMLLSCLLSWLIEQAPELWNLRLHVN